MNERKWRLITGRDAVNPVHLMSTSYNDWTVEVEIRPSVTPRKSDELSLWICEAGQRIEVVSEWTYNQRRKMAEEQGQIYDIEVHVEKDKASKLLSLKEEAHARYKAILYIVSL